MKSKMNEPAARRAGDLGPVDGLAQLSFLVQGALARITAEHDLSIIQTRLLGVLRDRTPSMNALASHLELDKSSVTGLVDRAEQRGLVRRKASVEDRRAVEVSITPAGRKLVQRVEAAFAERIALLLAPLSATERAALSALATRIVVGEAAARGLGHADVFPESGD